MKTALFPLRILAFPLADGGCVVYGDYSSIVTCNANNTAGTTMTYDGTTCSGANITEAMPFTSNVCTTLGGDVYYKVVCTSGNSASAMDAGLVASAVAGVGAALMAWL
ncbi:hypothetical protein EON66_01145 [archaeon]|nr:MAG: hypothetical protein EON66_01145 [archaeon]